MVSQQKNIEKSMGFRHVSRSAQRHFQKSVPCLAKKEAYRPTFARPSMPARRKKLPRNEMIFTPSFGYASRRGRNVSSASLAPPACPSWSLSRILFPVLITSSKFRQEWDHPAHDGSVYVNCKVKLRIVSSPALKDCGLVFRVMRGVALLLGASSGLGWSRNRRA